MDPITIMALEAAATHGIPLILDLCKNWNSGEPVTPEALQARIDALPKADDAFPEDIYGKE